MKAHHLLIHYIKRYFIGFLAVFMCSVIVASVAESTIKNYIIERTEANTQAGIEKIGELIVRMDLIDQMISENQDFINIRLQQGNMGKADVMKLKKANELYTEISLVADYVPYLFTLFADNDLFLSTGNCTFHFSNYYQDLLTVESPGITGLSSSEFKDYLIACYQNETPFIPVDRICFNHQNKITQLEGSLLYLTTTAKSFHPKYISCFVIDRDFIVRNILTPELGKLGFLSIQDADTGEVLLNYGQVPDDLSRVRNGEKAAGSSYYTIVNEQETLNWRVVTGIPASYISSQMKPVNTLLLAYILFGICCVVLMTLYYSIRQYSGMKNLIAFSEGSVNEDSQPEMGEYSLIADHITKLKTSQNDYKLRAEELTRKNQAVVLENMFKNGVRSEQDWTCLKNSFDEIPGHFCVAIVRYNQLNGLDQEQLTVAFVEELHAHYPRRFLNGYSGNKDELFLFQLDPAQMQTVDVLKIILKNAMIRLTINCGTTMHIGISAEGTELSELNLFYEQACQIVQAQYAYSNENRIEKYDRTVNERDDNLINLEFMNRLYTLITCGKQTEAVQLLDQIQEHYMSLPYVYQVQKDQIFYSIKNVFCMVCHNINGDLTLLNSLNHYSGQMTCYEMMQTFKHETEAICTYIYQAKKSKNEGLCQRILDYIGQNYSNSGLSTYVVSTEMGISEKYLSQFMKEQIGETFSAYLLRLRIDKAKEFLENTNESNEKIAELTGFGSVNTFYRNFSKCVGVTPKIYKETYQKTV